MLAASFLGREKQKHPSREVTKVSRYLKKLVDLLRLLKNGIALNRTVYILVDGSEIPNNHLRCRKNPGVNEGIY